MLILPKKYIDEIDIIELKKRQLRNKKQRKSVEEAYQEYKKNYEHFYNEKARKYIEDNFFNGVNRTSNMDILMQLYSELDLDIGKHTFYDEHLERIDSIFGLDRDIIEVASGYIPAFANKIAKKQLSLNRGTITIYEPELFEEKAKYSNMSIHKEKFTEQTKINKDALGIGILTCDATEAMIRNFCKNNMDFYIAMCSCAHNSNNIFPTYQYQNKKVDLAENLLEKYSNHQKELKINYLDNEFFFGYAPIIYTKQR